MPNKSNKARPRQYWRPALFFSLAAVFIQVVVLSFFVDVKRENSWMDTRTGSMKYQTEWIFGYKTPERIESSALETWQRKNGQTIQYDWRFLHGRMTTFWGATHGWACGSAPPIYHLRSQDQFVEAYSHQELTDFLTIMRLGSEQEQERAVREAMERVIEAMRRDVTD